MMLIFWEGENQWDLGKDLVLRFLLEFACEMIAGRKSREALFQFVGLEICSNLVISCLK